MSAIEVRDCGISPEEVTDTGVIPELHHWLVICTTRVDDKRKFCQTYSPITMTQQSVISCGDKFQQFLDIQIEAAKEEMKSYGCTHV